MATARSTVPRATGTAELADSPSEAERLPCPLAENRTQLGRQATRATRGRQAGTQAQRPQPTLPVEKQASRVGQWDTGHQAACPWNGIRPARVGPPAQAWPLRMRERGPRARTPLTPALPRCSPRRPRSAGHQATGGPQLSHPERDDVAIVQTSVHGHHDVLNIPAFVLVIKAEASTPRESHGWTPRGPHRGGRGDTVTRGAGLQPPSFFCSVIL